MRAAYAKYSGARGFTPDQFRGVAEQIAGVPLTDFWNAGVTGTQELDYAEALSTFGLRFQPRAGRNRAWLGVSTRDDQGRLVVTSVGRGGSGTEGALLPDDEILAIDDTRVRADQLARRLEQHAPGARVSLLVARRDQLIRVPVTLGNEPGDVWDLGVDPAATEAQRARLAAWLQSRS
jgi:predicted metalloprotease with PDZ domain